MTQKQGCGEQSKKNQARSRETTFRARGDGSRGWGSGQERRGWILDRLWAGLAEGSAVGGGRGQAQHQAFWPEHLGAWCQVLSWG